MDYEQDDQLQLDGLIDRLKQYIGANPKNAIGHYNLALAFMKQNQLEDAEFAFKMALEFEPDMVEAHINLGGLYLRQEKLDEAIQLNKRALELNPRAILAYNNIGFACMLQGRLEEAAQAFRQAIDQNSDLIPARISLARVLERQEDHDGAMEQYECILKINPAFALAHYNLALGYLAKGEAAKAAEHYQEAVNLNFPVDPEVGKRIEAAKS